jgi:hypothetical protein
MPRLADFNGVSQTWVTKIAEVASSSVKQAIDDGASFMRQAINNSPTTHPWHARKNDANGFPGGARIGNTDESFGEVDPNSGLMLNSVETAGPLRAGPSQVVGFFGWINTQKEYFLDQDTGGYDVGAAMGMGLLNGRSSRGNVMRDYGAKVVAEQSVIKSLKASGLKFTGTTGELF